MSELRASLSLSVNARQFRIDSQPPVATKDIGSFRGDVPLSPSDKDDFGMDGEYLLGGQEDSGAYVPSSLDGRSDFGMDAYILSESWSYVGMSAPGMGAPPSQAFPEGQHNFGMDTYLESPGSQRNFPIDSMPFPEDQEFGADAPLVPAPQPTEGEVGNPPAAQEEDHVMDFAQPIEAADPTGNPSAVCGESHVVL
jgi:hypothetical protein